MTKVDFHRQPINLFPTLVIQYSNVISESERKNIFDILNLFYLVMISKQILHTYLDHYI